MISKLFKYSIASIGPVGGAGAQFALSLVLLHQLDTAEFGRFSFLIVLLQLSLGLWGAMFCAPLPALLAKSNEMERLRISRCLIGTNGICAAAAFFVFFVIAVLVGVGLKAAALFGLCGSLALLRWYARAHFYAIGDMRKPVASDAFYTIGLLIGIAVMSVAKNTGIEQAFEVLVGSATFALLPFGRKYLVNQVASNPMLMLRDYVPIWNQHSRWALVGVVTTEATANAHVYIVTLFFGPSAYAPLAASALLIRPVQVAMNALSEFERGQIARHLGVKRFDLAFSSVRFFRWVLVAIWILTGLSLFALLTFAPRLVFPSQYKMPMLVTGAALWMAVAAMRLMRTPDSVLLQACGAFQPLASASVFSALFSIAAVVVLMSTVGPMWSIGGILLGEALFAWCTLRQSKIWRVQASLI